MSGPALIPFDFGLFLRFSKVQEECEVEQENTHNTDVLCRGAHVMHAELRSVVVEHCRFVVLKARNRQTDRQIEHESDAKDSQNRCFEVRRECKTGRRVGSTPNALQHHCPERHRCGGAHKEEHSRNKMKRRKVLRLEPGQSRQKQTSNTS